MSNGWIVSDSQYWYEDGDLKVVINRGYVKLFTDVNQGQLPATATGTEPAEVPPGDPGPPPPPPDGSPVGPEYPPVDAPTPDPWPSTGGPPGAWYGRIDVDGAWVRLENQWGVKYINVDQVREIGEL